MRPCQFEELEAIRSKRLRRLDENWKTINGTHVEVGGEGEIIKGPERLKGASADRITKKRVKKAESEIRHHDIEHVVIFGKDGKEITHVTGEKDCCRIPSELECSLKGATLTHNHPGNGCLSVEDLAVFEYREMKELRAICTDGTVYSLERVNSDKNPEWLFAKGYKAAIAEIKAECDKIWEKAVGMNATGELSDEGLNTVADRLNRKMDNDQRKWIKDNSMKYGYRYTEETDEG